MATNDIDVRDIDDLGGVIAFVKVCFKAFGYDWQHYRVQEFLQKSQAKVLLAEANARKDADAEGVEPPKAPWWGGKWPWQASTSPGDCLPPKYYRLLAKCLVQEVWYGEEPIKSQVDYRLAVMQSQHPTLMKQLELPLMLPDTKPVRDLAA